MHIKTIVFKTDYLIEPFDWIDPNDIKGYSPTEIKQANLSAYLDETIIESSEVKEDVHITEYYQQWFNQTGNIEGYIDVNLWMMIHLYSSYAGFNCYVNLRDFIPKDSIFINRLFERITTVLEKQDKKQDYYAYKLVRIFLFELFQYGSEWGVFVNPQYKSSVFGKDMTVKQAREYNYICSYLYGTNLTKLEQIEAFDKGEIPNYKYS